MRFIILYIFLTIILSSDNTIYFVYNAQKGFHYSIKDFFHKSLAPNKYPCSLCKTTYGMFVKKNEWNNYLNTLQYNYEFVYLNQSNYLFLKKYNSYPMILIGDINNTEILLTKDDIDNCNSLNELILLIDHKLKQY